MAVRDRARVAVLHTLTAPDGTTRFVDQMIEGAAEEVDTLVFSWKRALVGRFDVLHVHWPEQVLRGQTRRERARKRFCFLILLARVRLLRRPIVRTLHNIEPHEPGGRIERLLLKALDRRTSLFVKLNPTTELPVVGDSVTILHGHYRDRFEGLSSESSRPGRLLYFGLIRPYKGVDLLVQQFHRIETHSRELRIVGRASRGMDAIVHAAVAADPRISARLEFVSDQELVSEVKRAELIVLPYREMHNSGVVLVALSLSRPVLVPRTPANALLANEVGPGWVHLFDSPLSAEAIEHALASIGDDPAAEPPWLQDRDWDVIGEALYQAYIGVLHWSTDTDRAS